MPVNPKYVLIQRHENYPLIAKRRWCVHHLCIKVRLYSIILAGFTAIPVTINSATIPNLTQYEQALATTNEPIDCSKRITLSANRLSTYQDEQRDNYCSRVFLRKMAPNGFIAIFGGNSRFNENTNEYKLIRQFAKQWSELPEGLIWPIASGGHDGIMDAAIRGAREARSAKTVAIGLSVNIVSAGKLEKISPYLRESDHFVYRDIFRREADLVKYAHAIVIGLGGLGTTWEMMNAIDVVHIGKKGDTPIVILASGNLGEQFSNSFFNLVTMKLTASTNCKLFNITNSPAKAVQLILMNKNEREKDRSSACFKLPVS